MMPGLRAHVHELFPACACRHPPRASLRVASCSSSTSTDPGGSCRARGGSGQAYMVAIAARHLDEAAARAGCPYETTTVDRRSRCVHGTAREDGGPTACGSSSTSRLRGAPPARSAPPTRAQSRHERRACAGTCARRPPEDKAEKGPQDASDKGAGGGTTRWPGQQILPGGQSTWEADPLKLQQLCCYESSCSWQVATH